MLYEIKHRLKRFGMNVSLTETGVDGKVNLAIGNQFFENLSRKEAEEKLLRILERVQK